MSRPEFAWGSDLHFVRDALLQAIATYLVQCLVEAKCDYVIGPGGQRFRIKVDVTLVPDTSTPGPTAGLSS